MSEPSVALDEVNPAPTVIVASAVAYLNITTPLSPVADETSEPQPPVFVPVPLPSVPLEPEYVLPAPPPPRYTDEPVIEEASPTPPSPASFPLVLPPTPPAPPPPPPWSTP